MENEFISYTEALALKELGFNQPCFGYYTGDKKHLLIRPNMGRRNEDLNDVVCTAPLYQQAFRWFREKYKIQATIEPTKDQHRFELGFNYWIWNTETAEEWFTEPRDRPAGDYIFDSYGEAELECLKKLIEIIKTP